MSELKPKRDDGMAADEAKGTAKANSPQPSPETKPHGDKLGNVFKDSSQGAK